MIPAILANRRHSPVTHGFLAELRDALLALDDLGDWEDHAACKGAPPDVFFPGDQKFRAQKPGDGSTVQRATSAARKVCHSCPVRVECAAVAISRKEKHGVWGGLTHYDRPRIIRLLAPRERRAS